jgi:2'-5' RNA ligase
MPPSDVSEAIRVIQQAFTEKYKSKAALKPPVPITLIPPYYEVTESENDLVGGLSKWGKGHVPFIVELHNYAFFNEARVVFIDVTRSEMLMKLQADLVKRFNEILHNAKFYELHLFHPHITIGHRNIDKQRFKEIKEEYGNKKFQASFEVNQFHLWKHNGKIWETLHSFDIG